VGWGAYLFFLQEQIKDIIIIGGGGVCDRLAGGWGGWGGGARGRAGALARLSACVHTCQSGPKCPSISTLLLYAQGVWVCEWVDVCVRESVSMGSQYLRCVSGYECATARGTQLHETHLYNIHTLG
jgi:hypothetical protein